jgi:hypothetical protein
MVVVAYLMTLKYELKRYAAYYKGWCQAFGEHESVPGEDTGISWLFSEKQFGFISPRDMTKSLLREILRKRETPTLTISRNSVRIGKFDYQPSKASDESALYEIANFLEAGKGSHIFLTSHFMYGTGTRILTLSSKKPVPIIYKEIGTMFIKLK